MRNYLIFLFISFISIHINRIHSIPEIKEITFTESGASLNIEFNANTDRGATLYKSSEVDDGLSIFQYFNCTKMLDFPNITHEVFYNFQSSTINADNVTESFTEIADCFWLDSANLRVRPGYWSTLTSGDDITLLENTIQFANNTEWNIAQTVSISASSEDIIPVPVISGPTRVSSCGDYLTLSGSSSYNLGGRKPKYTWSGTYDNGANIIDIGEVDTRINGPYRTTKESNILIVDISNASTEASFNFELTVTNHLGNSATVDYNVTSSSSASPVPTIYIVGNEFTFERSKPIELIAEAKLTGCTPGGRSLGIKWEILDEDLNTLYDQNDIDNNKRVFTSNDPHIFRIGPNFLDNGTYVIRAKATDEITRSTRNSKTITIIDRNDVIAYIKGGEKKKTARSPKFILDASSSFYPSDPNAILSYNWKCWVNETFDTINEYNDDLDRYYVGYQYAIHPCPDMSIFQNSNDASLYNDQSIIQIDTLNFSVLTDYVWYTFEVEVNVIEIVNDNIRILSTSTARQQVTFLDTIRFEDMPDVSIDLLNPNTKGITIADDEIVIDMTRDKLILYSMLNLYNLNNLDYEPNDINDISSGKIDNEFPNDTFPYSPKVTLTWSILEGSFPNDHLTDFIEDETSIELVVPKNNELPRAFPIVLPMNSIVGGNTYTFQLNAKTIIKDKVQVQVGKEKVRINRFKSKFVPIYENFIEYNTYESYSKITIKANEVPVRGKVIVDPWHGEALLTVFKIAAKYWETNVDALPLKYKYTLMPDILSDDYGKEILLHRKSLQNEIKTVLPMTQTNITRCLEISQLTGANSKKFLKGDCYPTEFRENTLRTRVTDSLGASRLVDKTISMESSSEWRYPYQQVKDELNNIDDDGSSPDRFMAMAYSLFVFLETPNCTHFIEPEGVDTTQIPGPPQLTPAPTPAPTVRCQDLGREPCSVVSGTCGPCNGTSHSNLPYANRYCKFLNSTLDNSIATDDTVDDIIYGICFNDLYEVRYETDIDCGKDCQPCSNGKACESNSDCISNSCYENECIDTKQCPNLCTGRGDCKHYDYSGNALEDYECLSTDIDCYAVCECYSTSDSGVDIHENYYGDDCSISQTHYDLLYPLMQLLFDPSELRISKECCGFWDHISYQDYEDSNIITIEVILRHLYKVWDFLSSSEYQTIYDLIDTNIINIIEEGKKNIYEGKGYEKQSWTENGIESLYSALNQVLVEDVETFHGEFIDIHDNVEALSCRYVDIFLENQNQEEDYSYDFFSITYSRDSGIDALNNTLQSKNTTDLPSPKIILPDLSRRLKIIDIGTSLITWKMPLYSQLNSRILSPTITIRQNLLQGNFQNLTDDINILDQTNFFGSYENITNLMNETSKDIFLEFWRRYNASSQSYNNTDIQNKENLYTSDKDEDEDEYYYIWLPHIRSETGFTDPVTTIQTVTCDWNEIDKDNDNDGIIDHTTIYCPVPDDDVATVFDDDNIDSITVECNGIEKTVTVTCVTSYYAPECRIYNGKRWSDNNCQTISYNSDSTLCKCNNLDDFLGNYYIDHNDTCEFKSSLHLGQITNDTLNTLNIVAYFSEIPKVIEISTVTSSLIEVPTFEQSPALLIFIYFILFYIWAFHYVNHLDNLSFRDDQIHRRWTFKHRMSSIPTTVYEIEDRMRILYQTSYSRIIEPANFWNLAYKELSFYHEWFSPFLSFSDLYTRDRRLAFSATCLLTLATCIAFFFWVGFPDKNCSEQNTIDDCEAAKGNFDKNTNACFWIDESQSCHYVQDTSSSTYWINRIVLFSLLLFSIARILVYKMFEKWIVPQTMTIEESFSAAREIKRKEKAARSDFHDIVHSAARRSTLAPKKNTGSAKNWTVASLFFSYLKMRELNKKDIQEEYNNMESIIKSTMKDLIKMKKKYKRALKTEDVSPEDERLNELILLQCEHDIDDLQEEWCIDQKGRFRTNLFKMLTRTTGKQLLKSKAKYAVESMKEIRQSFMGMTDDFRNAYIIQLNRVEKLTSLEKKLFEMQRQPYEIAPYKIHPVEKFIGITIITCYWIACIIYLILFGIQKRKDMVNAWLWTFIISLVIDVLWRSPLRVLLLRVWEPEHLKKQAVRNEVNIPIPTDTLIDLETETIKGLSYRVAEEYPELTASQMVLNHKFDYDEEDDFFADEEAQSLAHILDDDDTASLTSADSGSSNRSNIKTISDTERKIYELGQYDPDYYDDDLDLKLEEEGLEKDQMSIGENILLSILSKIFYIPFTLQDILLDSILAVIIFYLIGAILMGWIIAMIVLLVFGLGYIAFIYIFYYNYFQKDPTLDINTSKFLRDDTLFGNNDNRKRDTITKSRPISTTHNGIELKEKNTNVNPILNDEDLDPEELAAKKKAETYLKRANTLKNLRLGIQNNNEDEKDELEKEKLDRF